MRQERGWSDEGDLFVSCEGCELSIGAGAQATDKANTCWSPLVQKLSAVHIANAEIDLAIEDTPAVIQIVEVGQQTSFIAPPASERAFGRQNHTDSDAAVSESWIEIGIDAFEVCDQIGHVFRRDLVTRHGDQEIVAI